MELINNGANIFFFVTTIFVLILIILATILILSAVKLYKFVVRAINQGDVLIEEAKTNNFVKKAAPVVMPVLLPILTFFAKKKFKKKK